MEIRTNNRPRHIICGFELSDKEKQGFEYLAADLDTASFFRYKGQVYDLGEFMRIGENSPLSGWHGYASDSYFSGIVVKYCNDYESVIVGRYFS